MIYFIWIILHVRVIALLYAPDPHLAATIAGTQLTHMVESCDAKPNTIVQNVRQICVLCRVSKATTRIKIAENHLPITNHYGMYRDQQPCKVPTTIQTDNFLEL